MTKLSENITKTKIVFITTVAKSYNQLRGQLRYLSINGLNVHCISSPGPDLNDVINRENAQIHPILMQRNINPIYDVIAIIKIVMVLRKLRPNIVHAGTPKGGFLGIIAASIAGVPCRIFLSHGLRFSNLEGIKRGILYFTEKLACMFATKIYCVSNSLRKQYIELNLSSQSKISVPLNGSVNGVDSSERYNPENHPNDRTQIRKRFNITKDSIVIGFVGRIVKDKGFIELIQAWNKLKFKALSLHLLLVGPFESEDPIPSTIRRVIESDEHIHLIGTAVNPAPYYTAMDIYVLPSYREGLPTTILEASAMELPVVATRVTGCVDAVINGKTGILVNVRDHNDLANAILTYCENPDMRRKHGQNGRTRVIHEFNPESTWEYMKNEFYSLLHSK